MLAYDLIGFQTEEAGSFHHYIQREMGGSLEDDGVVRVGNRTVKAAAFLIGIDAREFSEAVHSPRATEAYERLKAQRRGQEDDHRRRPPRLFQGPARAVRRLSPLPRGA